MALGLRLERADDAVDQAGEGERRLFEVECAGLDLGEVEHVVDDAQQGLSLVSAIAPGSTDALLGDPARVRQVCSNLLGNRLELTDRGGWR